MATNVGYANGLVNGRVQSAAAGAGRFILHFVEMFVAMMVSMAPYMALAGKPTEANRIIWYAGMEFSMIPGMIILMLYQRHGWRHSLEMAGAMLIGPVVFLSCAQFGLHNYIPGLSRSTLFTLSDVTMTLGMLGAMLYRRDMYARPHGAHQHATAGNVHAHHPSA